VWTPPPVLAFPPSSEARAIERGSPGVPSGTRGCAPEAARLASVYVNSEGGTHARDVSALLHLPRHVATAGRPWTYLGVDNHAFEDGTLTLVEATVDDANAHMASRAPVRLVAQRACEVTVVADSGQFGRAAPS